MARPEGWPKASTPLPPALSDQASIEVVMRSTFTPLPRLSGARERSAKKKKMRRKKRQNFIPNFRSKIGPKSGQILAKSCQTIAQKLTSFCPFSPIGQNQPKMAKTGQFLSKGLARFGQNHPGQLPCSEGLISQIWSNLPKPAKDLSQV